MLLALAGFACLSVGDVIVKSMAGQMAGSEIALLRYAFGALGLGCAMLIVRGRLWFICPLPWLQFARACAVACATFGFFMGVQYMPIANATAIQFTSPMLTALLSAVLLRERAPFAAWVATAMAFVGVLIILRPEVLNLGFAALFPLMAALSMALLMICNRKVAGSAPLLELQFLVAIFALPVLCALALGMHLTGLPQFRLHMPSSIILLKCACVAITGTISHGLIYMATQRASAAIVAPMMYVQLLMAVVLGWLFFHNIPTAIMLLGAGIIIAGGVYLGQAGRRQLPTPLGEGENA